MIVLGSASGAATVPLAALGGALASGAALYALAWRRGVQGYRLVLVGIGLAAFMQAGVSYVLTEGPHLRGRPGLRVAGRLGERPRLGARLAAGA